MQRVRILQVPMLLRLYSGLNWLMYSNGKNINEEKFDLIYSAIAGLLLEFCETQAQKTTS